MIGVVIADDHPAMREGLGQLLATADDIEVTGFAADGEEAVELAIDGGADVVLMDLEMPVLDGIAATARIRAERPATQVVALTSFSDRERILDAIDAGAAGYLLKDADPEELLNGVRAAARGESPLAPKAASAVIAAREQLRPERELTPREREVLSMVGEGLSNKAIARRMDISEKTVKTHLTRVFERIGVTDRTQAALWVRRHSGRSL